MNRCIKCDKNTNDLITTAYGELLCEDCYDDYLFTNKGKVEYLIGFTTGELNLKDYDADFLGHIITCWKKYRNELSPYIFPSDKLKAIEDKAYLLGLL